VECAGINQVPFHCVDQAKPTAIQVEKVDTIDWLSVDSDGDTLDDGNDDVDHDDVSNLQEYRDFLVSGFKHRKYGPLDACVPNADSRFCLIGGVDVDKDGLVNAIDTDDDGDLLSDTDETRKDIDTNPLVADTDRDGVDDGFEYFSAIDLNVSNRPYPFKRPYPNPLDGGDGDSDFDQDSLTQKEEYKAWWYTYCGAQKVTCRPILPLTYSDGTQFTGGRIPATGALASLDTDQDTYISDDEKDVDSDYLSNFTETHGPLSSPSWWNAWIAVEANKCNPTYVESAYPGPAYQGLDFVDPDTDGDGVVDGRDDTDHDGYTNWFEQLRPGMVPINTGLSGVFAGPWCSTYDSTVHHGSNVLARVQPFNPCKPTYSDMCHRHPQNGYYDSTEDWEARTQGTVALPYGTQPWET
jgi:hypothetical protein